jgi:protein TonB
MRTHLAAVLLGFAFLTSTGTATAAAPLADPPGSTTQLLDRANAAFVADRLVAPPGDNALELFVAVRARDPGNGAAYAALLDLFPFVLSAIESRIARGDLSDARRVLDLIEFGMPGSAAVARLRSRAGHGNS